MNDLALTWDTSYRAADLSIDLNDLETDGGLETAVLLSLFTDRRSEMGDPLPAGQKDRRGWWADETPVVENDLWGSRLWLLAREKQAASVLERAETYAAEALQWMIQDKIARSIEVAASFPARGLLALEITISRPEHDPVTYRYDAAWTAQEAKLSV